MGMVKDLRSPTICDRGKWQIPCQGTTADDVIWLAMVIGKPPYSITYRMYSSDMYNSALVRMYLAGIKFKCSLIPMANPDDRTPRSWLEMDHSLTEYKSLVKFDRKT